MDEMRMFDKFDDISLQEKHFIDRQEPNESTECEEDMNARGWLIRCFGMLHTYLDGVTLHKSTCDSKDALTRR